MMILYNEWWGLPLFDHTDIKSVVVGSGVKRYQQDDSSWVGDTADEIVSDIKICLRLDPQVALICTPYYRLMRV